MCKEHYQLFQLWYLRSSCCFYSPVLSHMNHTINVFCRVKKLPFFYSTLFQAAYWVLRAGDTERSVGGGRCLVSVRTRTGPAGGSLQTNTAPAPQRQPETAGPEPREPWDSDSIDACQLQSASCTASKHANGKTHGAKKACSSSSEHARQGEMFTGNHWRTSPSTSGAAFCFCFS